MLNNENIRQPTTLHTTDFHLESYVSQGTLFSKISIFQLLKRSYQTLIRMVKYLGMPRIKH